MLLYIVHYSSPMTMHSVCHIEGSIQMHTQKMLNDAAEASQEHRLLEPSTRGAILRAIAIWIKSQPDNTSCTELIRTLLADPDAGN